MKNFSLIVAFLLLNYEAYSQTVKGYVMDNSTKDKISYSTIYLNGTFIGTIADQNGYFQLQLPKSFSMPLTISALGYYSATLTKYYLSDTVNIILLDPKVFKLQEVLITGKAVNQEKRKEYLMLFRNEFLGTSIIGKNCRILNENDISLSFDTEVGSLKAYCAKPIIISNNYLGYNIEYYLDKFEFHYLYKMGREPVHESYNMVDKFEYSPVQGLIVGNYKFIEIKNNDPDQQRKFENRRKTAYLGSRMQFFRELWKNNLDSAGFELKDSLNHKIDTRTILIESKAPFDSVVSKSLKFDGRLFISYYSKRYSTIIKMTANKIYFHKNGFFDPYAIIWEGKMSNQRIGEILPFEYHIKETLKK
jgi:hypothetical protein